MNQLEYAIVMSASHLQGLATEILDKMVELQIGLETL